MSDDYKKKFLEIYRKGLREVEETATRGVRSASMNESIGSNLPGRVNGPADAYRHVLLSAELTRRFGERYARFLLEGHEIQGNTLGQEIEANKMDEHNNELGIRIGNRLRKQKGGSSWEDVVIEARKTINPDNRYGNGARWLAESEWKDTPLNSNWPVEWKQGGYSKFPIPNLEDYNTRHDEHSSLTPVDTENIGNYFSFGSNIPNVVQPLAQNASPEEFRAYGFAALLSDDPKMHVALDSLMDSDIGRNLRQNADNVQAAYDRQQELERLEEIRAQQVDAPVKRMVRS
ncbi:hypothetical protein [Neisseria sp.]|uniref:DUF6973 domain-containing protein n=1 Tax=Neisseria sp. TaxID=192066 RepID=UPI0035A0DD81